MTDLTATREVIHTALTNELFGPSPDAPKGTALDLSKPLLFGKWEDVAAPYHDALTKEEILTESDPLRRYGVGVLHPSHFADTKVPEIVPGLNAERIENPPDEVRAAEPDTSGKVSDEGDDLDLTLANSREQSTIGLSFRAHLPVGSRLRIDASFGVYSPIAVQVADKKITWWLRRSVTAVGWFTAEALTQSAGRRIVSPQAWDVDGPDAIAIELRAFSRMIDGQRLVTVTVTNRSSGAGNAATLFQSGFSLSGVDGVVVLPYRERRLAAELGAEEQTLRLLYRNQQTFAIGHGCAADWPRETGSSVDTLHATALPSYEAPSVTPDIIARDGSRLRVDMRALAQPDYAEAEEQVRELLASYEAWIEARVGEIADLPAGLQPAAEQQLAECRLALGRMQAGWQLVTDNALLGRAFRLANEAMLTQQARSTIGLRRTTVTVDGVVRVEGPTPLGELPADRGYWRPFQIAFLLASLSSTADGRDTERGTIELIFFPTGGGKTEAYLALAAFSMLLRRLRATRNSGGADESAGSGTDVLMRYTLRLLTAQQFLRAASLICALERLRERYDDLGTTQFSIGIWLGGDTTPNTHKQAVDTWNALAKDPATASNKFLLLQCPWCAAQMGPTDEQQRQKRTRGHQPVIPGYLKRRDVVRLACPDRACDFRSGLPMYVVDDDIYDKRPTLVIGTVDKFAMLAWRERARNLFGLDDGGRRELDPPNLIIQDEFHLISGPLGSMVGLYEAVIEDLCTDRRSDPPRAPKIVASTATIRRYAEQSKSVYGRDIVRLFPPLGINADDAFFAVWARDAGGALLPGRRYVGVHAPSLGSTQTVQVRVGASLLQAPLLIGDETQQDPWWTNLWFFNSLRELGNTLSLMQSDIPDYIVGLRLRDKLDAVRFPGTPLELTGRRRDDEVPRALQQLEVRRGSGDRAVSVCLASNIIEVGVDIDRMSLMTVVGQPKTTAQYIQVSGRVGRRWWERPGLVVTIYGAQKPRDRSHFERFRSYHDKLYAQVEPTSVTPFAKPVMQRALRGALVAYVRMYAPIGLPPWPYPSELVEQGGQLLLSRLQHVDAREQPAAEELLERAKREWQHWGRATWDANYMTGDPLNGLMRFPGTTEPPTPTWEIPSSMRNVDAECRTTVTTAYHEDEAMEAL